MIKLYGKPKRLNEILFKQNINTINGNIKN